MNVLEMGHFFPDLLWGITETPLKSSGGANSKRVEGLGWTTGRWLFGSNRG